MPVSGVIRVNKKSEDSVLMKHMFWGEKTDNREVKKGTTTTKPDTTESLMLYKVVREGLSKDGASDLRFRSQTCEDLGCNKIGRELEHCN